MSTLKRFFKDTIIYGIAAVLPRAINILLVKLHTKTLSADKYAENTIFFVYAAYFNAILTYGMETAFFRFFTKEKEKGKVVSTSFISILLTTLLFLIIMLINSNVIAEYFGFTEVLYLRILILVTVFDTLVVIPYAYLRVMNKPVKFAFYKTLNIGIYAIFNIFFLWYIPNVLDGTNDLPIWIQEHFNDHALVVYIFIANLMASITTFILLLPIIFKFKLQFDQQLWKKMLNYGLPIMVGSLAFVTNENLDKLLLTKYLGKEQMGIYAACYKLGVFMTLYVMAFRLGAEPFFFNQSHKSNAKETYAKIMKWFTIIGVLFMLIVVLFIDFFAGLLLGDSSYFKGLYIVPIILLANLCLGIYNNLSIWYKLTDKTRYGMYFSVLGAVLTIILNITFVPLIGFIASAWATLATYSFMAIISYFYGKKHYLIKYPVKQIMTYLFFGLILSTISFIYLRGNILVSFLFIITFITFLLYKEKKEIQFLLKK